MSSLLFIEEGGSYFVISNFPIKVNCLQLQLELFPSFRKFIQFD